MAAPLGFSSTMHRVLDIPEILALILSFLDKSDLAVNVCVCKRWSEVALDLLWRNVDDLHRLLKLLAPLVTSDLIPEFFEYFDRTLTPEDWRRFARYARRVRKLSYMNDASVLGLRVFDEIARSRTSLNILPNLHTLEWKLDSLRLSLMFMGENVRQFTAQLHGSEIDAIAGSFEDIAERMPQLMHLDLSFHFPVHDIEDNLVGLIHHLPKLQKIILPLYCFSSKVVEALSTLPHLGIIQFEFMKSQGRGDVMDVHCFAPHLAEGAFPVLWDLSLSCHLSDMTRFINNPYAPANLTSLYVHVLSTVPPARVTEFLVAVSQNCKLLTSLYIDLFIASDTVRFAAPASGDRLSWDDLRPILSCTKLTTFELRWDLPLKITQDDVEELASQWPLLQVLMLNCDPVPLLDPEPASLTLSALIPFAQHCPDLRELGLFVSGTVPAVDPPPLPPACSVKAALQPFRKLTRFCVGLSSISDPAPVALFLSQLCPLGCEIVAGVSWPDGFGIPETEGDAVILDQMQRHASEWYDNWKEVSRVLPLLTTLRFEERERRKALEKEVEDLRIRCKLLEERATLPLAMNVDGSCVVL